MIGPAIKNLRPTSTFSVGETYDTLNWLDESTPPPTRAEVAAEVARLTDQWNNTEYQRVRAEQYPSISDQLDMLWHAMDVGALPRVDSFYDAIKAVKDANPKP
jgi:hypothetical protein